jgi:predicted TIM-barrel enzyme
METVHGCPVDTAASAVVEMALADRSLGADGEEGSSVRYYNIVNNTSPFHWTSKLLPELKEAGLHAIQGRPSSGVDIQDMMRKSLEVSRSDERTSEDPSMKLFDFWERRYGLKESREEE